MEPRSRTRLVTIAVLAVVFASGLVLGAAVQGNVVAPIEVAAAEPEQAEEPAERRIPMYEQVGPSAEQSVLIAEIVADYRARREAARSEAREEARSRYNAEARALILEVRESILGIFSEEQAGEYRALLDEADRRRAEREDDRS
jgi:hypothetical protein